MRVVLADTGPLLAFLSRRDAHHAWAVDALGALRPPLVTCEAVLSEACYLVREYPAAAESVLELVKRGVVAPTFRLRDELAQVAKLISRYGAARMDLADACLVRMSELYDDVAVLTLDSQFRNVYRRNGRQAIPVISPGAARQRHK